MMKFRQEEVFFKCYNDSFAKIKEEYDVIMDFANKLENTMNECLEKHQKELDANIDSMSIYFDLRTYIDYSNHNHRLLNQVKVKLSFFGEDGYLLHTKKVNTDEFFDLIYQYAGCKLFRHDNFSFRYAKRENGISQIYFSLFNYYIQNTFEKNHIHNMMFVEETTDSDSMKYDIFYCCSEGNTYQCQSSKKIKSKKDILAFLFKLKCKADKLYYKKTKIFK